MTKLTPEQKLKMMEEALKIKRVEVQPQNLFQATPVVRNINTGLLMRIWPKSETALEAYIIVPTQPREDYPYRGFAVSMYRSHPNKTWVEAHDALHAEHAFMLTPRMFVDFVDYLYKGMNGEAVVYNGNRHVLDKSVVKSIRDSVIGEPGEEWLDAEFGIVKGSGFFRKKDFSITYRGINVNGKRETFCKTLADCLMEREDKVAWLGYANQYGLPPKNYRAGRIGYYPPHNGCVARFVVGYDSKDYLDCSTSKDRRSVDLGVRAGKVIRND